MYLNPKSINKMSEADLLCEITQHRLVYRANFHLQLLNYFVKMFYFPYTVPFNATFARI